MKVYKTFSGAYLLKNLTNAVITEDMQNNTNLYFTLKHYFSLPTEHIMSDGWTEMSSFYYFNNLLKLKERHMISAEVHPHVAAVRNVSITIRGLWISYLVSLWLSWQRRLRWYKERGITAKDIKKIKKVRLAINKNWGPYDEK
jgi:hypothetical protein